MSNVAELLAAIADDVDDTTGEYAPQIKKAVQAAVRYCERDTFYFNETRDVTFTTVTGQQLYDKSTNPNIGTIIRIQQAYLDETNGQRSTLLYVDPVEMELSSDIQAIKGAPYSFTYFAGAIRLYPVPQNSTDTIRLQLGPYRLVFDVNAGTATNVWTEDAYDMVKARAKYVLYKDTLKDATLAAEALNDYNDQRTALLGETALRNGSGYVQATEF